MKLKKLLTLLLSLIILCSIVPLGTFTASAATSGTTGDCTWELDGTTLTISGKGRMDDENLSIPSGGDIIKVIIEDGVTYIGKRAFFYFNSLTSITIPDSVKSIGNSAFGGCSSLTSITIPDSVTSIGVSAFRGCSSLISITLPNNITSIEDGTFADCCLLTSIIIPDSITTIGVNAFQYCSLLKRVNITDLDAWLKIEFENEYSNPLWYGAYLYLNNQLVTEIKIPDGTQFINEYQCYNMKDVEDVFIPKSLLVVKQNAFNGCKSIKNVYYEGTSEEWNCVNILEGNDYLKNAVVYYNSTGISGGIISRPISFVAISTLPTKREYVLGEKLDLTGGKIAVGYPEGNYEIFDLHDAVISDYDTNKTGYQIITVTYKGHITEFTVAFFKNGDLDGDENINATDVAMLRINLLVNSDHNTRCDINKDGTTDIRDLVNLKKKTVEIIA